MRSVRTALFLLAFAICPVAVAAPCAGFTDVDSTDPFCTHVTWIKNRGITVGCALPTLYCPNDSVTRLQMAIFMYRQGNVTVQLGGNATGGTARLGTSDNQPVEIIANNQRGLRIEPNATSPNVIGGSSANNVTAGVRGATIAGGGVPVGDTDPEFGGEVPNQVTDAYGTVGGGFGNRAGDDAGTTTDHPFATVGGGRENTASGTFSIVGGGLSNTASGFISTVGGGQNNNPMGDFSTVSGGADNTASGHGSTIVGGEVNTASGPHSTVVGGQLNAASGELSLAAGFRAKASTEGSFIWADHRHFDFGPTVPNFFGARATGGVGFTVAIDPTTGAPTQYCNLLPGVPSWSCVSDRDVKENFVPADGKELLARLVAMPLFSWNFKGADPRLRMLGPTAQDFRAAFGLGTDDKTIASANLDGVALAAIQGLNAKLEAEVVALRAELVAIRSLIADRSLSQAMQTAEIDP